MDRYEMIKKDALWVITGNNYGSNVAEKENPGSKAKAQAKRIAEFVRQLDETQDFLNENDFALIEISNFFGEQK